MYVVYKLVKYIWVPVANGEFETDEEAWKFRTKLQKGNTNDFRIKEVE